MRSHEPRGTRATLVALMMTLAVTATAVADTKYPIMQPDQDTIARWIADYNAAAELILKGIEARGSYSVLSHLDYIPDERDQGTCGNCWAWPGTGCMEVAHHVENGVFDRLSIQYLNSKYCGGSGPEYACCGGWLSDLVSFYAGEGFAIPWSNANAAWQDGDTLCTNGTTVPGASISTTPNYGITHIEDLRIPTQEVTQADAIANIKAVLNNDQAVWFTFFLADFGLFNTFWSSNGETDVWDFDPCGGSYQQGDKGAHSVLCVGYNDDDPDNSYWIMVNSWGTTLNRPNGIFRVDMDMDYSCSFTDLVAENEEFAFYWKALDVEFGASIPTVSEWGLIVMTLLLLTAGTVVLGRRRKAIDD